MEYPIVHALDQHKECKGLGTREELPRSFLSAASFQPVPTGLETSKFTTYVEKGMLEKGMGSIDRGEQQSLKSSLYPS